MLSMTHTLKYQTKLQFKDLVEPSGGKTKVSSDASDELYGGPMWADDMFGIEGRRFFSTASPHVTPDPTQSDFPSYQYTQADVQFMPVRYKPNHIWPINYRLQCIQL